MSTKELAIKGKKFISISGVINIGFAIFHCWMSPRHFDWIAFFLLFFAFICLFHTNELITTKIGRATAVFNSSLYIIRILMFLVFFTLATIKGREVSLLRQSVIVLFCGIGAICLLWPVISNRKLFKRN